MDGILVAGNLIVDVLYAVAAYPRKSELTSITKGTSRSVGGAACNVILALARLDPFMDLTSVGIMGDDAEADFIEQQLEQYENIDISQIKRKGKTSFTVVMSESASNSRTLFHFRGANATLCEEDFNLDAVHAKIMHIGYILLLDALDQPDRGIWHQDGKAFGWCAKAWYQNIHRCCQRDGRPFFDGRASGA